MKDGVSSVKGGFIGRELYFINAGVGYISVRGDNIGRGGVCIGARGVRSRTGAGLREVESLFSFASSLLGARARGFAFFYKD